MNLLDITLKQVLELLRGRVKNNAEKIRHNNNSVKTILQSNDNKEVSSIKINTMYSKNAWLTNQNATFHDLHAKIMNFVKTLTDQEIHYLFETGRTNENSSNQQEMNSSEDKQNDDNDQFIFDQTIEGIIPINRKHPKIKDSQFFKKVLSTFQEREEYEKCAEIIHIVGK